MALVFVLVTALLRDGIAEQQTGRFV
ncbi:hypothetical protein CGLO_16100 [Colletotrichum gloeosporioides Cg-14]|uniref:Uncharacterized protein n=1 Tax=Colletotrichum gloeosporioides (strain Cg-14) TaxID=1237896 RepID=T0LA51_COLGC|nr:hypothetical protein CGLO_16100 [Colletotrichum gloeosporioides Cg-14]